MEVKKLSKKGALELLISKGVVKDKANIICIADGMVSIDTNNPIVVDGKENENIHIDIITDEDIHIGYTLEDIINLKSKYLSITIADDEGFTIPGQSYKVE